MMPLNAQGLWLEVVSMRLIAEVNPAVIEVQVAGSADEPPAFHGLDLPGTPASLDVWKSLVDARREKFRIEVKVGAVGTGKARSAALVGYRIRVGAPPPR